MSDIDPLLFDLSLTLLHLTGREADNRKNPGTKDFISPVEFPIDSLKALKTKKLIKQARKANIILLTGPGFEKSRKLFNLFRKFQTECINAADIKHRLDDLVLLVIYLSAFKTERNNKPGGLEYFAFTSYRLEVILYFRRNGYINGRHCKHVLLMPEGQAKAVQLSRYYGIEKN